MESHERAQARRDQTRRAVESFQKRQTVQNIDDIKRVLAELDPHNRLNSPIHDPPVSAIINGVNDNRKVAINVTAKTSTKTHRDMILDGIKLIRQRRELSDKVSDDPTPPVVVNGRQMSAPALINVDGRLSIDPIIERVTGGRRVGELICWDLPDGFTYKYDIFQHRLTRVKSEQDGVTASG